VDVGTAIVDYVRHGRPASADRAVFLHMRAPFAAMTCDAATHVVRRAAVRAGLGAFGPHRLRHTAATQMLQAETPLIEVGQVLRHRSVSTTAIYAKVDRGRLRELAVAWPLVSR
jgi:site-specific recombinase XerD